MQVSCFFYSKSKFYFNFIYYWNFKIKDEIDKLSRAGKPNTKFEKEEDFQAAAIKEAEEAKKDRKTQAEESERRHRENLQVQKENNEILRNHFNQSNRTPPPNP